MTNDLSQCGNCIYHYTYNGNDMCKHVGDDFYLQWKVEDCPYHTTITSAIKISDEIYRLRAENADLRERLEKSVDRLKAREKSVCFGTEWKAVVTDEDIDEVFGIAEARLAELKGEFHEITN